MYKRETSRKGFTLIELMIVIAIIAIIAAIAIPNLLDARKAANEASAIATLRAIHSAQNIYREQDKDGNGTLDYSANLVLLYTHGLVDELVGYGEKQGYGFITNGDSGPTSWATLFTWSANCAPEEQGDSGDRQFRIDHTGVIRYTIEVGGAVADELWPAIGK